MSLAKNKKAYFDYHILAEFEAGLVLSGPEVKSIKAGEINLKGSYIDVKSDTEAYLINAYVAPYKPARSQQLNYDPYQPRKLLLHRKEIKYLYGKAKEPGLTVVPLEVYLSHGLIKLKIAVVRGKKKYDKREAIKQREFKRRQSQALKY